MSSAPTTFVSDRLAFDLPVAVGTIEDRTVHELVIPGVDTPFDLLLAISRERLAPGRDVRTAVGAMHDRERRSLGAFEVVAERDRRWGEVVWIDTSVIWKHPNGPVYHRRMHCQLGACWLCLTVTAKLGHRQRADDVAEHVASTFRVRPSEE